jgi:ribosomal-protein-alanine N-acetyltransferase
MSIINFTPFPNLITHRFSLRELKMEDDKEIFILRSDKTVNKYLGKPRAKSIGEARDFIEKITNGIADDKWIMWAIEDKGNSAFIGTICLWNLSDDLTKADIGFELLPDHFGKGVMQEVIPEILNFGFNIMNLFEIEGEVDPENIKSIKLMEKFGFSYSDKLESTVIYSLKKPQN